MQIICELDAGNFWTGLTAELGEGDPLPVGWVIAMPPEELPEGFEARHGPLGWECYDTLTAQAIRNAAGINLSRTICQVDNAGLWTGATRAIGDFDALPLGWVDAEPPADLPEGDTARYMLSDGWTPVTAADAQALRDAANAPVPIVIDSVTMRQARLALLGAGLLAQVEAAFDALPEPNKSAAKIEWEFATALNRDHPLVASLAVALGLTDEQIDALFLQASAL